MAAPFTVALQEIIAHVRALTGGRLVWKDADPGLRRAQPRAVAIQDHPGCMEIKRRADRRERCIAWCGMPGRGATGRGTCHAGLVQWRWRVDDAEGAMGEACFGPFARGRADMPEPPGPEIVAACRGLVCRAIAGLADLRRQELGRLGWTPRHPCLAALLDHLAAGPVHEGAAALARRVRISPSRLQHLCRAELGHSLRELRDRHLLDQARRLLLDPAALPVRRVAGELGFRDQRVFATWFRRCTGATPSAWRSRDAV